MANRNYKIDLHTHSIISYDGGITAQQYENLLSQGILDAVAITDHHEIKFAKKLHQTLGDQIIIGEEILTTQGEIIGLFLEKVIPKGLAPQEAIRQIKNQNGLVYLPHPFETIRKGIPPEVAQSLQKDIDIIETFNARGLIRGKAKQATQFANQNNKAQAASSDAHTKFGIGTAFSLLTEKPTRNSLINLLEKAEYQKNYAPAISFLAPSINKIKNLMKQSNIVRA